jgi:hypothetical protein
MESRDWNRAVGWSSLAVGIAVGLVIGLWSFDGPVQTPSWIGGYADTSRRLLRLGHIAFIGLGILNILLADELSRTALGERARAAASRLMVAGNVFLPLALIGAAAWRPVKYAMGLPAMCVFGALLLAAWGSRRANLSAKPEDQR